MRTLVLIATVVVASLAVTNSPASARIGLGPVAQDDSRIMVRGGHGHGHMFRGGRGHHYGWGRGRGHHYGWRHHRHHR